MKKDLISIIVPVYKAENFLERCVRSILAQTYNLFEIFLVDDGSPDSSPALCDKLAKTDKRINVIHKENGGPSSARNAGLEKANGEFVCFVDSDDAIDERYVELLHESIVKNESDVAICLFDLVDNNGNKSKIIEKNIDTLKNYDISSFFYNSRSGLVREDTMGSVCRLMVKTELIKDLKFPTELAYCEDLAFILKILEKKPKIRILHEYLYHYYCNNNSTFSTSPRYLSNLTATRDYFVSYLEKKNPELIIFVNDDYIYKTINHLSHSKHFVKNLKLLTKNDKTFSSELTRKNGKFMANYHSSKKRKIFTFLAYNKHFFLLSLLYKAKN